MRIYLDLLPTERKQEIKRKKLFRGILREEFLFIIPVIVFIFILLNIYYVLTLQKDSMMSVQTMSQSQEKYRQLSTYEEKFKEANFINQALIKIQSGHLYWQKLFRELSNTTPDGIYVSDLSTKDFSVFLVGKARTREDLLGFKEKLESAECFETVNVPLSNLVVKDNVDFQIDLKIKEDCLKNSEGKMPNSTN